MSALLVLLIIIVGVNGRLIEPVEKLVDISDNVIERKNKELKNIATTESRTKTSATTKSIADHNIGSNHASSDKHDSTDIINEIDKEHISRNGYQAVENVGKQKADETDNLTPTPYAIENKTTVQSDNDETAHTLHEAANNKKNCTLLSTTELNQLSQEINRNDHIRNSTINDQHNIQSTAHLYEGEIYEENLKLTPYINKGHNELARNASEVNSSMFLGYKSYSGYLTVEERYDSNTFFWYFPVVGKPAEEAPWIIWLQGGPGSTSMYGLLHEIGPFTVDKTGALHKNPYSWLQNQSLVFIDNPVGVGFSYTNHEDGYARSMEDYSAHLYKATRQLLLLFPELQRAPLYIAGESYAGKYVPSLALELHNHQDDIRVNLQGILLNNAVTGPHLTVNARPWLSFGVVDAQEARTLQPSIDSYNTLVAAGNYEAADKEWQAIATLLRKHSHLNNLYNFLQDKSTIKDENYVKFLRKKAVKKALHSQTIKFIPFSLKAYKILRAENGNVQSKIEALLEHYKVLSYCGNLDLLLPCSIAAENHRKWNWTGLEEFVMAPRETFRYNGSVAGYFKTGGRFTEAVVIGAGHMVPADKPAVTLDLITKWIHGKPLNYHRNWSEVFRLLQMNAARMASKNDTLQTRETQNKTDHPASEIRNQTVRITPVEVSNTEAEILKRNDIIITEYDTNQAEVKIIDDAKTVVDESDPHKSKNQQPNSTKLHENYTVKTTTVMISNNISDNDAVLSELNSADNWKKAIDEAHISKNESLNEIGSSNGSGTNKVPDETKNQFVNISTIVVSTTEADMNNNISDDNEEQRPVEGPLILTPYLKEGLLEQARNASEVNSTLFLGYKSYSGFFTVNETYNSNTFFWYFPVEGEHIEESPCVIWLQGGPGFTSFFGLAAEIGPFSSDNRGGLMKNPSSWLQNHSLVFIDNPVGTGFSFTEHQDGYAKDMETYSGHLYSATRQLLQLFPELQRAPLYIAGESYAGKYVPSLALELHNHKDEIRFNLQGLLVGNGYIAPAMLFNFSRSFYEFGLLGPEDLQELRESEILFEQSVIANDSSNAKDLWIDVLTDILRRTELRQSYNFLHSKDWTLDLVGCLDMVEDYAFNRAIHVGSVRNHLLNMTVTTQLKAEFLSSAKEKYEQLMEHYRVLLYCGQLDQMMSCGAASQYHETFDWSGRGAFLEAHKEAFKFNDKVAVYHKTGGNLTEAVVRGAGHTAPLDQGAPLRAFVTWWTHQPSL